MQTKAVSQGRCWLLPAGKRCGDLEALQKELWRFRIRSTKHYIQKLIPCNKVSFNFGTNKISIQTQLYSFTSVSGMKVHVQCCLRRAALVMIVWAVSSPIATISWTISWTWHTSCSNCACYVSLTPYGVRLGRISWNRHWGGIGPIREHFIGESMAISGDFGLSRRLAAAVQRCGSSFGAALNWHYWYWYWHTTGTGTTSTIGTTGTIGPTAALNWHTLSHPLAPTGSQDSTHPRPPLPEGSFSWQSCWGSPHHHSWDCTVHSGREGDGCRFNLWDQLLCDWFKCIFSFEWFCRIFNRLVAEIFMEPEQNLAGENENVPVTGSDFMWLSSQYNQKHWCLCTGCSHRRGWMDFFLYNFISRP